MLKKDDDIPLEKKRFPRWIRIGLRWIRNGLLTCLVIFILTNALLPLLSILPFQRDVAKYCLVQQCDWNEIKRDAKELVQRYRDEIPEDGKDKKGILDQADGLPKSIEKLQPLFVVIRERDDVGVSIHFRTITFKYGLIVLCSDLRETTSVPRIGQNWPVKKIAQDVYFFAD